MKDNKPVAGQSCDIWVVDDLYSGEPLDSERVKSTLDAYFKVRPFVDETLVGQFRGYLKGHTNELDEQIKTCLAEKIIK